jgi:anti-sigma regulatory factor (Ser/Thr protein kinase)
VSPLHPARLDSSRKRRNTPSGTQLVTYCHHPAATASGGSGRSGDQADRRIWRGQAISARDFRGDADQVREARHWIEDLLPECDALADILLLASEVCANAVMHTRSRQAGGQFSVDVEWGPELARVIIADQGSLTIPAVGGKPGQPAEQEEFGRGLWLVDELADDWGTSCHPAGRVVWIDIKWQARGGPPLQPPGGMNAAIAHIAVLREAFPGTTIWWDHQTQAWWAALPGAAGASGLISSPSPSGLRKLLADGRPHFPHDAGRATPRPARPQAFALAVADQPENVQGR